MLARLRACVLSLLLAFDPLTSWSVAASLAALTVATEAAARSSGGYSRPSSSRSSSSYSRTPSTSRSYSAPSRTPSTSGGYRRPSTGSAPSYGGSSDSDRAISRQRSSGALDRMRTDQMPPSRTPQTSPGSSGGGWIWGTGNRRGSAWGSGGTGSGSRSGGTWNAPRNDGWYGSRGWSVPGYATAAPRRFGIWDGLFLWFLLSNLNRPGSTDFFRNHQDDPGVREWRAEAERQAQGNSEISGNLRRLDEQLAASADQPRDPDYLPPDVPRDVATIGTDDLRTPSTGDDDDGGGSIVWLIIVGGIAIFVVLAWRRRRAAQTGSPSRGGKDVGILSDAGAMLRHKLSGETYKPQHFRVGMTLTVDPTPFLLAGNAIKAQPPEGRAGDSLITVKAVGRVTGGPAPLTRLYLPDGKSMFQLHEGAGGSLEECRFFGLIDEVTPADQDEWGAWLDRAEGMIGWPEFETKDGKVYGRHWAPGDRRIEPHEEVETVETLEGTRTVRRQSMLYSTPTNLQSPAPPAEYILVSAVQEDGQAWVEIRAGIDINPASLAIA